MTLLDLSKADPGVSEPYVFEVVFQRAADVALSLHVVAPCLLDDEGVLEIAYITRNRIREYFGVESASEGVLELTRVR